MSTDRVATLLPTSSSYNTSAAKSDGDLLRDEDHKRYRSMVGALSYLESAHALTFLTLSLFCQENYTLPFSGLWPWQNGWWDTLQRQPTGKFYFHIVPTSPNLWLHTQMRIGKDVTKLSIYSTYCHNSQCCFNILEVKTTNSYCTKLGKA